METRALKVSSCLQQPIFFASADVNFLKTADQMVEWLGIHIFIQTGILIDAASHTNYVVSH